MIIVHTLQTSEKRNQKLLDDRDAAGELVHLKSSDICRDVALMKAGIKMARMSTSRIPKEQGFVGELGDLKGTRGSTWATEASPYWI